MALTRSQKEEIVQKVDGILKESPAVVFTRFHGLPVSRANEMRQAFRHDGIGYTVAKKTLIRRALSSIDVEGETPSLSGELALAYLSAQAGGNDPVALAKSVVSFAKKSEGAIEPMGGIFEGRYITAEEVKALAAVPSREALYGQFVSVINAPIQQTVGVLNAVTQSFVGVLHQIAEQKS